jgi:hypothetical protein
MRKSYLDYAKRERPYAMSAADGASSAWAKTWSLNIGENTINDSGTVLVAVK